MCVVIVARLFFLQVIKYGFYQEAAAREHSGYTELPAKRGEILVKDYTNDDTFTVASNTTMDLIFVDPKLIQNKTLVATALSETLFDLGQEREKDNQRIIEERREFKRTGNIEAYDRVEALSDEELKNTFYHAIVEKVSRDVRSEILLSSTLPQEILDDISSRNLNGIEIAKGQLLAYPSRIYDKRYTAIALSEDLQIAPARLEQILIGENRYEVIVRKVDPENSKALRDIIQQDKEQHPGEENYLGIGFKEEYYRYYPESTLAANILGFVDKAGSGQYGIEETFDKQLKGKKGIFKAQRDSVGRQITVGESVIEPAVNGFDITLTIDRTIQLEVERILKRGVDNYRANSGQVIILDPKTSKVIAMAHYPTFNPNQYSEAFNRVDIDLSDEEAENLYPIDESDTHFHFYRNTDTDDRYEVFKDVEEGKDPVYQRYENWFGAEVYQNKIAAAIYEPGSVYKPVAMAAAIDDGDVTPNHTFYESGPIEVDEYVIRNSTDEYRGRQTMTNVLEQSSNVGMAYVAKKIGRNLFYSYMMKFGFGEKTGIEFDTEEAGHIEYFTQWADSELVTHAFGQGITVTPLQMANAYAALANKGVLMQPYIVESIEDSSGKVVETEPVVIGQAVSDDTANKITAMLVSAVENGVASPAQLDHHYVAGKTGTSQTYKWGRPLEGAGTTITSFAGYGPVENPQFVVLVKLDRPRASEWGSQTAAPIFTDIAEFLFDYYNIPPDK
ncbi:peptidoglycan D,D-transpeptidase FtsI family protein [Patescibacteria group bacterium]